MWSMVLRTVVLEVSFFSTPKTCNYGLSVSPSSHSPAASIIFGKMSWLVTLVALSRAGTFMMVVALGTLQLSPSISTSGWCSNISRRGFLSFVLLIVMVVVSGLVVVVVVTSTVTIPWSLVVVVPIVIVVAVVGVVGVVGIVGVVGVVVSAGFCCTYHLIHEAARHAHSFIKFLGIG